MRPHFIMLLLIISPLFAQGQMEARIDTVVFSNNILIKDRTARVDHIIEELPAIIIKATVVNRSNKDILLIPTNANYQKMTWITFKQGIKYYYIPTIWIDYRPWKSRDECSLAMPPDNLHIGPNGKIHLTFWGYAPDTYTKQEAGKEIFSPDLYLDMAITPPWVSGRIDYPTWFQEVLPSIRLVMMYGLETGQPSVLVSKPVDLRKTIITGNILDQ